MLATALRVGTECAGCVLAGTVAVELAPWFWNPKTDDKIEERQRPLLAQSRSLSAEFTYVLRQIEAASLAKLEAAAGCCAKAKAGHRRAVAAADVDELCANLCGGDADLNEFVEVLADNTGEGHGEGPVVERYRLVPTDEIAKLTTAPAHPSTPTTRPRHVAPAAAAAADVLAVLAERDRYAADLLENFELQQQRIGRQLEYAAAACIEPREAQGHTRAVLAANVGLYLLVCMGIDRVWAGPGGATAGTGSDGSSSKSDAAVRKVLQSLDRPSATPSPRPATTRRGAAAGLGLLDRVALALPQALAAWRAPAAAFAGVSGVPEAEAMAGSQRAPVLAALNGGHHLPRARPPLARALLLALPAAGLVHYLGSSLLTFLLDDGDDEEGDVVVGPLRPGVHSHPFLRQHAGPAAGADAASGPAAPPLSPSSSSSSSSSSSAAASRDSSALDAVYDAALGSERARTPLVWLGATKDDPFTPERLSLTLLERPAVDGFIHQGLLFLRLAAAAGPAAALACTPLVYALNTHGSVFDLRALLMELRSEDAFVMNDWTGFSLCVAFYLTGRVACSVFLHGAIHASFLASEFRAREDLLCLEALSIWPVAARALSWVERYEQATIWAENWLYPVEGLMARPPGPTGAFSAPQPTAALRRLADAVMATFATSGSHEHGLDDGPPGPTSSAPTATAKPSLSWEDVEDLSEALKQAMVRADTRDRGALTVFERARRMEYQQYLAAAKIKHPLPDVLKHLLAPQAAPGPGPASSGRWGGGGRLPPGSQERERERLRRRAEADLAQMERALRVTAGGADLPYIKSLFEDARHIGLRAAYPRGAPQGPALERFLVQQLLDLSSRAFIANHLDVEALTRHLTKWESKLHAADAAATDANAETEFLDFLQYYYWTLLCELQYEAVRFARVHVPLFHDTLAGRQATVDDVVAYEAALATHFTHAGRRASLMALAPHGLTERRFRRLLGRYEARFPAVGALRAQWEAYFAGPAYRKTVSDIVNPLATPAGEPHRQGNMATLLQQAAAR